MRGKILLFFSVVLMLGCASTGDGGNKNLRVSKKLEETSLVVCRASGGHLALRGIDLMVGGKEITTLRNGTSAEVIVPPGKNVVSFKFPWDSGMRDIGVNVDVPTGGSKNIVIGTNLDGFVILPHIGGFMTTWRVAEAQQLPAECLSGNRAIHR